MAPSIQVFVQVALCLCVVTTSMGGIIDWEKEFSQLENKVKNSQEEMKSLHQIIQNLEKRLQIIEAKGEFGEVQIQSTVPIIFIPVSQDYLLLTMKFMSYPKFGECIIKNYETGKFKVCNLRAFPTTFY